MKKWFLLALVLGLLAWRIDRLTVADRAPAKPSAASAKNAAAASAPPANPAAQQQLDEAKTACLARLAQTPAFIAASAEATRDEARVKALREHGDADALAVASTHWIDAKTAVEKLKAEALNQDADYVAARQAILDASPRGQAETIAGLLAALRSYTPGDVPTYDPARKTVTIAFSFDGSGSAASIQSRAAQQIAATLRVLRASAAPWESVDYSVYLMDGGKRTPALSATYERSLLGQLDLDGTAGEHLLDAASAHFIAPALQPPRPRPIER